MMKKLQGFFVRGTGLFLRMEVQPFKAGWVSPVEGHPLPSELE